MTNSFDAFFLIAMIFGAFFVLNLMVAVQFKYLMKAFENETKAAIET